MDEKENFFVPAPKNMIFYIGEDQSANVGKNKTTTVTNKISLQAEE